MEGVFCFFCFTNAVLNSYINFYNEITHILIYLHYKWEICLKQHLNLFDAPNTQAIMGIV